MEHFLKVYVLTALFFSIAYWEAVGPLGDERGCLGPTDVYPCGGLCFFHRQGGTPGGFEQVAYMM